MSKGGIGELLFGRTHTSVNLLTNLGIYRQDAKFAKVDLLTGKPQFPWRPWRLGGEFMEVICGFISLSRVIYARVYIPETCGRQGLAWNSLRCIWPGKVVALARSGCFKILPQDAEGCTLEACAPLEASYFRRRVRRKTPEPIRQPRASKLPGSGTAVRVMKWLFEIEVAKLAPPLVLP